MSRFVFDHTYPQHPSSLGEYLRKARMDAGLQIKELAQIAGLSEMTIVNWEQGRTRPREDKLARLTTTLTRCRCSPPRSRMSP